MKILLCTAALAIAVACVAQEPKPKPSPEEQAPPVPTHTTPPAPSVPLPSKTPHPEAINPATPSPATAEPSGVPQPNGTPPVPWGGVPMTNEQRLEMENYQLRISVIQMSARDQFQKQMQTATAPYVEGRRRVADEVVKAHPDYLWSEEQSTFIKKPAAAAPVAEKPKK